MVGINKIIVDELPIPEPKPGEVLIRVKSVGICGSDVYFFTHGRIGPHVATPPFILGHEASGEVHSAGKGVEGLHPGDRVTMEPGVPCKEFCPSTSPMTRVSATRSPITCRSTSPL